MPHISIRRLESHATATGSERAVLGYPRDGMSVEWEFDGRDLTLRNDRYGIYPAFYVNKGRHFAVSSSLSTLFDEGASPALDDRAMAFFVRLGYFLGEDTPFQDIRALPPGARIAWDGQSTTVTGQRPQVKQESIDRDSAIDGYIELFRRAMARRPPGVAEFGLPLSGGRDSRHIFLELCRTKHVPRFCVSGRKVGGREEDVTVAKLVAAATNVPHREVAPSADPFGDDLRKNRLTGFCADEHGWFVPVADYLTANTRVVYDGLAGDVLSAGNFLTSKLFKLYAAGNYGEFAETLMSPERELFIERALAPEFRRRWNRELARDRLLEELPKHAEAANPFGSYRFWNRTRRETALSPYVLLGGIETVYLPYLDPELFDFLTSLPVSVMIDGNFHTDTIARAYPEYAHLRYEDKTLPEQFGTVLQAFRDRLRALCGGFRVGVVASPVLPGPARREGRAGWPAPAAL